MNMGHCEFVPVAISQAMAEYASAVGELVDAKMVASMGTSNHDFQMVQDAEVVARNAKRKLEIEILNQMNQSTLNGSLSCKCGGKCAA